MTNTAILLPCNIPDLRLRVAKMALEALGVSCRVLVEVPYYEAANVDIVFARQPNDQVCDFLAVCIRSGVKVIIDISEPIVQGSKLDMICRSANLVTHPDLVQDGWDDTNEQWFTAKQQRNTFNVGLFSENIPQEVLDFLAAHDDTCLVIPFNNSLYLQSLKLLPERRRLFLPPMSDQMAGWLTSYFDVVCLNGKAFTDRPLMEAGARGIPWISTNYYTHWGNAGGIIASVAGWTEELEQLYSDPPYRQMLASAGKEAADTTRRLSAIIDYVQSLYSPLISDEVPAYA